MLRNKIVLIGIISLAVGVALFRQQDLPGPDPAAPAIRNQVRICAAVSGDTISLDGHISQLEGVVCPPPDIVAGRDARALLNTFLRAGTVRCTTSFGFSATIATCTVNGKNINAAIANST